jgi:hypothetical protein
MSYSPQSSTQHMPPPAPPRRTGISLSTLFAAAVASVVAALVVSRLWQAGTLWATAMTPVIIALVKEAIERPAQRVSSIASRTAPRPVARTARAVALPPPEADAPPPPIHDQALSEMRVYGRELAAPGRRWKLALITGVLAFVVCVAVLTLPELVAGRSVVNGGHDTTLFGGRRHPAAKTQDKTDTTTTDLGTTTTQKQTQTQTQPQTTTTPSNTTTTPPATTTPTTPSQTTPAPSSTTPAPSATTPAPPAGSSQTTPTTP